jgi:4-nitrophenyl phosphatase/NagD protein
MIFDSTFDGIEVVFLDLDGTIYLGDELIEGANDFLNRLKKRGIKRCFLSNNSSKSVNQYVEKLNVLGIDATVDEILLSTHDLISYLKGKGYNSLYLVGTEGMREMLIESGLQLTSKNPEVVVLGYDTEMTYQKLAAATTFLHAGIPLIASHPDIVCPAPNGGLPDVGAFLSLIELVTGVTPNHICGKPSPSMIVSRMKYLGFRPEQCAMVGDRLYTDMVMARAADVHSILVLSGEATRQDVEALPADEMPALVVDSVDDLL